MSEKCKFCEGRVFDNDGQSYGILLSDGTWCCYDDDCLFNQVENMDKSYAALQAAASEVVGLWHDASRLAIPSYKMDDAVKALAAILQSSI